MYKTFIHPNKPAIGRHYMQNFFLIYFLKTWLEKVRDAQMKYHWCGYWLNGRHRRYIIFFTHMLSALVKHVSCILNLPVTRSHDITCFTISIMRRSAEFKE